MEIRKFDYNNKFREVLILEETSSNIKGIDMSYLSKEDKEFLLKIREDFDPKKYEGEKKDSDEGKSELLKIKPYMKYFRNFSKNKIDENP